MIDRTRELPLVRQCQILELSRPAAYYQPAPVSPADRARMRRIDELHLNRPCAGARMLAKMLKREGPPVGRRHVATLMKQMGIHALYRKPNTSKRHPAHPVYPSLLRNLSITRSNHVWAADITYIPMKRGFVYLFAVIDCVNDAKRGLEKYFRLYNQGRPHTTLDDQTPDEFYFTNLPALPEAA